MGSRVCISQQLLSHVYTDDIAHGVLSEGQASPQAPESSK